MELTSTQKWVTGYTLHKTDGMWDPFKLRNKYRLVDVTFERLLWVSHFEYLPFVSHSLRLSVPSINMLNESDSKCWISVLKLSLISNMRPNEMLMQVKKTPSFRTVLKKKNHSTRWKQDELVWLWWEEKNVEKERKGSWSRTCHTVYPLIMCKSNKDFLQVKKLDSLRQPSQSPDLNSSVRDECRMTHKQARTSCRKGLAENLKGANTFGNVWRVLGSQVFSFFKY